MNEVQIYAEPIQEDRGTTELSFSILNLDPSYEHPYVTLFRINRNGIRVPIYKSHVFGKKKRITSQHNHENRLYISASQSEECFTVMKLTFDNQTLLNGEPDCKLLFELWSFTYHFRDVYLGSVMIPGSSIFSAARWRRKSRRRR